MSRVNSVADMTEGKLLPKMILFTLPLIATAMLQRFFNIADTIVVGRWGGDTVEECEIALAAVGSCGALTNLIVNLFLGLSAGAGVIVAHRLGSKDYDAVQRTVHTSFLIAVISGIITTVIGVVFARPFLSWMGTDPLVLDQATPYMQACFFGMIGNLIYNYLAACLRSAGDTIRPLFFLTVSGIVNIILNLISVICFRLGALGVGIATCTSHWVSAILIVIYMMRIDGPCKFDFRKVRYHKNEGNSILLIGFPSGIQGSLFSISNVLIQSAVNSFPIPVVAGNTAASNLGDFIYTAENSLYHTALTFVGQNVGAKKYHRVVSSFFLSIFLVTLVGLFCGGMVFLFGEPLLSIFAPNNENAVREGMVRLQVLCLTYFLCGTMDVGCGTLRGLGKSFTPMVVSLLGSCVLRIIWIYTVFAWNHTTMVLYLSYPISWALTTAVEFIFCYFAIKQFKQRCNVEK